MAGFPSLVTAISNLETQKATLIAAAKRTYNLPQSYKLHLVILMEDGNLSAHLDLVPNVKVEDIPFEVLKIFALTRERVEDWIAGRSNTLPAGD